MVKGSPYSTTPQKYPITDSMESSTAEPEEHKAALVLSRSLAHAKEAFEKGERSKEKLISQVTEEIKGEPMSDIDYVEMYGMPGLTDISDTIHGKVLLAVAVKFGKTRLIDNVVLEAE